MTTGPGLNFLYRQEPSQLPQIGLAASSGQGPCFRAETQNMNLQGTQSLARTTSTPDCRGPGKQSKYGQSRLVWVVTVVMQWTEEGMPMPTHMSPEPSGTIVIQIFGSLHLASMSLYVFMCVCIYIYMHVCTLIYIYTHILSLHLYRYLYLYPY